MVARIVVFVILAAVIMGGWQMAVLYFEPQVSTALAVDQAKYDSTQAHAAMRVYTRNTSLLYSNLPPMAIVALVAIALFTKPAMAAFKHKENF